MDKREIELAKQNILKDRRRRLLYINTDQTSGQHIPDSDMKIYSTLKNSNLIGLLIFLLIFGIFGQSITLAMLIMVSIIVVANAYLMFVFLPKRSTIKLNQADINKMNSVDFLKAREANTFSQITILFVLSLMILLRLFDVNKPLTGLDLQVARFGTIFLMTYAAVLVPRLFKIRKARKSIQ